MNEDFSNQIEADIIKLETHSESTAKIRQNVIDKLAQTVSSMSIDTTQDKSNAIEAKMNIVNTLLKSISDSEDQRLKLIKLKQSVKRDKAEESALSSISSMVTDYLRKIDPKLNLRSSNGDTPDSAVCDKLDKSIESENFEILDTELEFTTQSAKDIKV